MNGHASVRASGTIATLFLAFLVSMLLMSYAVQPAVAFISPHMYAMPASAVIPVQLRVPRHADNRWVFVSWDAAPCEGLVVACDDHEACEAGSFMLQVDGVEAATILPLEPRYIDIRTSCPYLFEARLEGPAGIVRGRAYVRVRVY